VTTPAEAILHIRCTVYYVCRTPRLCNASLSESTFPLSTGPIENSSTAVGHSCSNIFLNPPAASGFRNASPARLTARALMQLCGCLTREQSKRPRAASHRRCSGFSCSTIDDHGRRIHLSLHSLTASIYETFHS
jgi:hypothetical protein